MKISGIYGFLLKGSFPSRWYIGQSGDVLRRKARHRHVFKHVTNRFYRALRKHGFDAFEFVVLEECPIEDLTKKETYWVEQLGGLSRHGFNVRTLVLA